MFANVVALVAAQFITQAISSVLTTASTDSEKETGKDRETLTSEVIQNVPAAQNVMVVQDTTTIQNVNVNVCIEKVPVESENCTSMSSDDISIEIVPEAPEASTPDGVQNTTMNQNIMAVQDTTTIQSVNVNVYLERAHVDSEPHGPMPSEGISIKVEPEAQTPETPPRRSARRASSPSPSPQRISSEQTPPRRSTPRLSYSSTHPSPRIKDRRRSSTSSCGSVSPQASNKCNLCPYDRATFLDPSSDEELRKVHLPLKDSKIRYQQAYTFWYETRSEKPLEAPPLVLLENLELADGYFFVNWTDLTEFQAWRYQEDDKSWKEMKWGQTQWCDSGDQGENGKELRRFVVTPETGVPSFVSRKNYRNNYEDTGYICE